MLLIKILYAFIRDVFERSVKRVPRFIVLGVMLIVTFAFISIPKTFAMVDIFQTKTDSLLDSTSSNGNVITCIPLVCNGTQKDDIIIGTAADDTIYGLDGNDNIQGRNGDDVIYGGNGDDTIQGGGGADVLFGQDGNDWLSGDAGSSLVFGGGGNTIYGGKGDDHLLGGPDNDVFVGGPGHDFFDCGEGLDRVLDFDPHEDTANTNCEELS